MVWKIRQNSKIELKRFTLECTILKTVFDYTTRYVSTSFISTEMSETWAIKLTEITFFSTRA